MDMLDLRRRILGADGKLTVTINFTGVADGTRIEHEGVEHRETFKCKKGDTLKCYLHSTGSRLIEIYHDGFRKSYGSMTAEYEFIIEDDVVITADFKRMDITTE